MAVHGAALGQTRKPVLPRSCAHGLSLQDRKKPLESGAKQHTGRDASGPWAQQGWSLPPVGHRVVLGDACGLLLPTPQCTEGPGQNHTTRKVPETLLQNVTVVLNQGHFCSLGGHCWRQVLWQNRTGDSPHSGLQGEQWDIRRSQHSSTAPAHSESVCIQHRSPPPQAAHLPPPSPHPLSLPVSLSLGIQPVRSHLGQ